MEEDSMNLSTSGCMMQNEVIVSPLGKSYQCSHCSLLFKSKVYLFEHLNMVHGFDTDTALTEAGLKGSGTNKTNPGNNSNSLGDSFKSQRCDFQTSGSGVLNEHENQCLKTSKDQNVILCGEMESDTTVVKTNQCSEDAGAKEISSVMSTSKSNCTLNLSKDLKTYKRPLQTISKYFAAPSESNEKPPVMLSDSPKLPDATKGTLFLQESPPCSAPNCSGVLKVTAKSTSIDITSVSNRFLLDDHQYMSTPKPKKFGEPVPDSVGKRTNSDDSNGQPTKKAKTHKEDQNLPEVANATEQQSLEFSFDISEDEGENKLNLVNGDTESSRVYFCKHCDYSDMGITCLSIHYKTHHPYVRYKTVYIQDPSDESATFRCLHCPIEFLRVADLKRHYSETHPEAPNMFKMQSHELSLVYKCFTCSFTTNALKILKKHWKENHPSDVPNSLMFCRYSVTTCQEESRQPSEKMQDVSTEMPCAEVRNSPSPRQPTSTGADVLLYHCNNCTFSHKSVIVMHVHYQKSHPDEEITIDKIKRSGCLPSQTTSQMMPSNSEESVTVTKKSAPPSNMSDSQMKTKDNAELSQNKCSSEASKTRFDSPEATPAGSAEDNGERGKSPTDPSTEVSAKMDRMFYCPFCSYKSDKIRSVIGHSNAKHALHALTSMEEISNYSADVEKRKLTQQVELHNDEVQHDDEEGLDDTMSPEGEAYANAENLFYCQKCNYGNTSVQGVANHQNRIHKKLSYNRDSIIQHTNAMRKKIAHSKSQPKQSPFITNLPLPLLNKGDEDVFFCYFCNYRHSSMDYILRHSFKTHSGCVVSREKIRLYTKMVRKKTANREVGHESLHGKVIKKNKTKKLGTTPSVTSSHPQRVLQCYRCAYSTQYVYVLRRHIFKIHKANRTAADILRVCYRAGSIQAGYHCDVCVFTHKRASEVYEHYLEEHPGRTPSLEYVTSRLYVGPDMRPLRKKIRRKKSTDGETDYGTDMASHRAEQNETKTYSCRACSFKSSSRSTITNHYRVVHPWSVKEDGSVLGIASSRRASASKQVEDDDIPHSFESYQVPLDFETTETSTTLKCQYCPAIFPTQHGLNVHCGMKHHEVVQEEMENHPGQIQTGFRVFKCPHCPYLNSNYHGILTHCKMKHPELLFSFDRRQVEETQLADWSDCLKSISPGNPGNLKISGYMCDTCPHISVTLEKLNKHCKQNHAMPTASTLSQTKYKTLLKQSSASHASSEDLLKCQYCSYSCNTKSGLDQHMRIHPRMESGSHYDDEHYASEHKQEQETPASTAHERPLTEQPENIPEAHEASMMEEKTILIYRCPTCPYVNSSYHGTLTHCQMKHPDIVARADHLQTEVITNSNLVRCTPGRSDNERGYMCEICPLIYPSMKKLKAHCEIDHSELASIEMCEKPLPPKLKKEPLEMKEGNAYRCHLCSYSTFCRKYLQCHLRNTHKVDRLSARKLLQKYNKRKFKEKLDANAESEESAAIKCIKCPELVFDSSEQLVAHYSTFHSSEGILDFTVLSQGTKKGSTGLYRCGHCNKQMNGTRKLWYHLDLHREKHRVQVTATPAPPQAESTELCKQDLLTLDSVEELAQWNVTSVQTVTLPPSPLSPSPKPVHAEQVQLEPREKHTCTQCWRTFMSLKGLRSHERSHAAVAALKKLKQTLPPSVGKRNSINKYLLYKAGTMRPFLCSICSYRTTVMGLWRRHFMKRHQHAITDFSETDNQEEEEDEMVDYKPFNSAEEFNNWPQLDEETEITEKSLYLEPPDVQRQLNHYSLMAQTDALSKTNMQELPESSLLYCEFCNFNTGHLSSMRRHYLNRHGKKILRCKDCEFVTGLRKTLEMHMEAGHSTFQSGPSHLKDLRCPFCLYQTKNKNNMIDHIVLHREERVVPIEVRRPKLSRYLQGIVFRCHKCTFTSGSADNLRVHMKRHNAIKPYKCRLCYFDSSSLSDLEAHLSDQHQVVRNHELVGQVSLDELHSRVGSRPEEETSSNMNNHNDHEDLETEDCDMVCNEVSSETQAKDLEEENMRGENTQIKETYQQQGQDGKKEEGFAKNSLFEESDTAAQEQDDPAAQPELRDCEARSVTLTQQKEEATEGSSVTHGEIPERIQAHKMQRTFQHRATDIDTRLEDDMLHSILQLDEDVSIHNTHKKASQERDIKTEDVETEDGDSVQSEILLGEKAIIPLGHNLKKQLNTEVKKTPYQANNSRSLESFTVERHLLTFSSKCAQLKMSHKESSGVSFTNCKREQPQSPNNGEEVSEPYGEMPVLENEYLKEEMEPLSCCKKENLRDRLKPKQDREGEVISGDDMNRWADQKHNGDGMKEAGDPHVAKGSLPVLDGAAEVPCPAAAEEKQFTCEYCGRNLMNSSDLERHILRHGL